MDPQVIVAALFVHGPRGTRPADQRPTPMVPMGSVEAVPACGLREDGRYFRGNPDNDRRRQVSLIDEGTIWDLEESFGPIPREFVKAQIVLSGRVDLPSIVGCVLSFEGGAELGLVLERVPCYAMDLIHDGLREAMRGGRQGALARVLSGGRIVVGAPVMIGAAQAAVG